MSPLQIYIIPKERKAERARNEKRYQLQGKNTKKGYV